MELTADELAGVVDYFGGLTRAELDRALEEAAFRAGDEQVDTEALETVIEEAIETFALVRYRTAEDRDPESLLVAGPTAFPQIPPGGEDVPHILDVDRRRVDRTALGEAVVEQFEAAVRTELGAGDEGEGDTVGREAADDVDPDRVRQLLEVSYDIEAWAPVDVTAERERLDAALEDG